MGTFDSTKEYIQSVITDNNTGAITGELLQLVLLNIVNTTETALNNVNSKIEKIDNTLDDVIIDYENE